MARLPALFNALSKFALAFIEEKEMREMTLSFGAVAKSTERRGGFKENHMITWWHVGAALGLAGSLTAGIVGFLLTAMSWLLGNELAASRLGQSAAWLIIAMIPLMALGAHCLDRVDRIKRVRRIEFCRRHGLVSNKWN